jgi:starvation-inducible DNA-binding protein
VEFLYDKGYMPGTMIPAPTSTKTPPEITSAAVNANNFEGTFNLNSTGFDPSMPGHVTPHDMILRQPPRTVKKEGSGNFLPYEVRHEMALMLDDHLCALTVALHQLSYIKHELEGRYTMRDFIRNDLEHELKIQNMLREQIQRAHDLKDFGTVEVLEEVLLDREDLGYHLFSVLEDDTLVRGMEHLVKREGNIAGDGVVKNNNKLQ